MSHRARLAVAAVALAAFAVILAIWIHRDTGPDNPNDAPPPVLHLDDGGLRLTHHIPTGSEALYDLTADAAMLHNLAPRRPDDVRRLHEALEERVKQQLGVSGLDELRRRHRELMSRLHALGYL